jgi:hypothetical protein
MTVAGRAARLRCTIAAAGIQGPGDAALARSGCAGG